jgi:dolichol-phosphate mannosyltransferase
MTTKEKNFVSAIIYVHNAEDRIENFLKTVIEVVEKNFEHSEVICVNDSSTDNSLERIREICQIAEYSIASSTSVSVVNMSYYHGVEAAMNAGVDLSIGDFVFEFDNTILDFEKDEIMKVYARSLQGFDIVSAVPDRRERFTSRLFYKVFSEFTDCSDQMHTESFRVLSRRVINRIGAMNITVPYRKAIYANQGLKTDSLVYTPKACTGMTRDKQENEYRSALAVDSLLLFTELGYRFSVGMTAFMMVVSVFMMVYSIVIFVTAHPVAGWTTTILFLSVVFFALFGILTIVIKYLQLLINLVFKKKQYSFEGIEKLTK